jgi:branched-chain amino acid transport system substrate-binding protein
MNAKKLRKALFVLCAPAMALSLLIGLFGAKTAAAAGKEILLGNVLPMSGPLKTGGEGSTSGSDLAVSEINAAGGVLGRPLKLITRDDEVRPSTGLKMIQELYEVHGVRLFLGGMSSGVVLALAPQIEKLNSVFVVTGAASADITGSKLNPRIFRINYDNATGNFALSDLMHKEYPDVHKWAGINPDYAWGTSSWRFFVQGYKAIDPKFAVTAERWPPLGAGGGYGPHVAAVIDSGAEGLYSSCIGTTDVAALIREGKAYGLFDKIKVFTLSHTDFADPAAIGKDMVSYWSTSPYYTGAYTSAKAKSFQKKMEDKLGKEKFFEIQGHAANGYDAVYAYRAAIEKAKTDDPAAVAKALEGISINSPVGVKTIRAGDHQSYHPLAFFHFAADARDPRGWKIDKQVVVDGAKYAAPVAERLKFE